MRWWFVALAMVSTWLGSTPARAELPSWLRTENNRVQDGNEKLGKGDAKGALAAYDQAARELPEAPGVQLDRGLALIKQGELPKAREALLAATQPGAPAPLRADAFHNLALSFYREGDQLAGQKNHKEAQQRFREALDAARRSLRLRPGDANAAWNLELAARRLREEEEKQKQEDQKQEDEKKDQQKDEQKQDQKQPDQGGDDKDKQPNQDQQQDQGDKDKPEPKQDEPKKPESDQAKQDPQGKDKGEPQKPPEGEPEQNTAEQALPSEAKQALDALSDGEENFERYRARQRANRERRAPEKDW